MPMSVNWREKRLRNWVMFPLFCPKFPNTCRLTIFPLPRSFNHNVLLGREVLLMLAKIKGKCHAGSILFVIQHRAQLEQDSSGMTSKYEVCTVSNY